MKTGKSVLASSFADMADLAAFLRCKADGGTDSHCFKFGDNGLGCWGDLTARDDKAMCALPPEEWKGRWGTGQNARGRKVVVVHEGRAVICELRDTMPHKEAIKNGCGIDLNPGAARILELQPPFKVRVDWWWLEDEEEGAGWFGRLRKRLALALRGAGALVLGSWFLVRGWRKGVCRG